MAAAEAVFCSTPVLPPAGFLEEDDVDEPHSSVTIGFLPLAVKTVPVADPTPNPDPNPVGIVGSVGDCGM